MIHLAPPPSSHPHPILQPSSSRNAPPPPAPPSSYRSSSQAYKPTPSSNFNPTPTSSYQSGKLQGSSGAGGYIDPDRQREREMHRDREREWERERERERERDRERQRDPDSYHPRHHQPYHPSSQPQPQPQSQPHRDRDRQREVENRPPPPPSSSTAPTSSSATTKPPPAATAVPKMTNPKKDRKIILPDPPRVIYNRNGSAGKAGEGVRYERVEFLGEGGFARVYSYLNTSTNTLSAVKVVPQEALQSSKKKVKLYAEIKIHSMMGHPHIVRFDDAFQDEENVYMTLELCEGGNLMDILRKRKSFTEPEARFYLTQLISACQYMHDSRIMHRDLKLGNVFVADSRTTNLPSSDGREGKSGLALKIGDFGLAALLTTESDRRKTMCGTPNYIAPEVLYDKDNGHSYEVDIWSLGVILYTMLVGKPPFQTKDISGIYQKIKDLDYMFPTGCGVSEEAMNLVEAILTPDPRMRPTLQEILQHDWFTSGEFPTFIPPSAMRHEPVFHRMSSETIRHNFNRIKRKACYGLDLPLRVAQPEMKVGQKSASQAVKSAIEEQEKEFKKAVQPDSPISALLQSARKPPILTAQAPRDYPSSPLINRKPRLPTATGSRDSPLRRELGRGSGAPLAAEGIKEEDEDLEGDEDGEQHALRRPQTGGGGGGKNRTPVKNRYPVGGKKVNRVRETAKSPRKEREVPGVGGRSNPEGAVLNEAAGMRASGRKMPMPDEPAAAPRVFIAAWLDYAHKYGMGFSLTDGSVGVHFNDTSAMVFSPNREHIDYYKHNKTDNKHYKTLACPTTSIPDDKTIQERAYLLGHFEQYMESKLNNAEGFSEKDEGLVTDMSFLAHYWRTKQMIAFRLSNGVIQFNYHDHCKLVLSDNGNTVSFIDSNYKLWTWHLAQLVNHDKNVGEMDRERRRMESAWRKVEFARDFLSKMDKIPNSTAADQAA